MVTRLPESTMAHAMIATSYLRVYQPLAAFSADERAHWQQQEDGRASEASASRRWLIGSNLPAGSVLGTTEGAFTRRVDGELLVCPWRTSLRMLAGLLAFRTSVPEEVADAFVPETHARRAAQALAALGEDHPEVRSHILHANWHVPLRWFAAFDDSERILTEDKEGLRIRYETPLSNACARLVKATEVLETSWVDDGVVEALKELSAWMSGFSEEGLVELDYGSVARIFSDEDLLEDRSAAEVWSCLDALTQGDVLRAGQTFASLTDRWTEVRAREVVN